MKTVDKQVHFWDANDGAAPAIQELIGSKVSHALIGKSIFIIRFDSGRGMTVQVKDGPDSIFLAVICQRDMPADTLNDKGHKVEHLIGQTFTAIEQNRFIFGEFSIVALPDQFALCILEHPTVH